VAYKAPNPIEVWHLPEAANQSIPEDIRSQFQQDTHGRVLFFTAPPEPPAEESKPRLAHSTTYLAVRGRQLKERLEAKKRGPEESEVFGPESLPVVKKTRVEHDAPHGMSVEEVCQRAMDSINNTLADGLIADCQRLYPEGEWQQAIADHLNKVADGLLESAKHLEECQAKKDEEARIRREELTVSGLTSIMDYQPPNEALEWRR
jgi:chromatin structure-remodeling complex subunit RSC1/2